MEEHQVASATAANAMKAEVEYLQKRCDHIQTQARVWKLEARAQQSITKDIGILLGGIYEGKLNDEHCIKENGQRFKCVPCKGNRCSNVNLRKLVDVESSFVNNVDIESEQPTPDQKIGYEIYTAEGSCKEEFKTHNCNYKNEGSNIGTIEKYFQVIEKNGFVKAWHRAGFFRLGFYFFRSIEILFGDDEDLAAGQAACAFTYVPVWKRYNCTTVWAVELNCHLQSCQPFFIISWKLIILLAHFWASSRSILSSLTSAAR